MGKCSQKVSKGFSGVKRDSGRANFKGLIFHWGMFREDAQDMELG